MPPINQKCVQDLCEKDRYKFLIFGAHALKLDAVNMSAAINCKIVVDSQRISWSVLCLSIRYDFDKGIFVLCSSLFVWFDWIASHDNAFNEYRWWRHEDLRSNKFTFNNTDKNQLYFSYNFIQNETTHEATSATCTHRSIPIRRRYKSKS